MVYIAFKAALVDILQIEIGQEKEALSAGQGILVG